MDIDEFKVDPDEMTEGLRRAIEHSSAGQCDQAADALKDHLARLQQWLEKIDRLIEHLEANESKSPEGEKKDSISN